MVWYRLTPDQTALLISMVKANPCLWDHNHKEFKKTSLTKKLWTDIGSALDLTGNEAKTKWKNLKDKFRKDLNEHSQAKPSSSETLPKRRWKFYKMMLFTKDLLVRSPTYSSSMTAVPPDPDAPASEPQESNDTDKIYSDDNSGADSFSELLEPIMLSTGSLNQQFDRPYSSSQMSVRDSNTNNACENIPDNRDFIETSENGGTLDNEADYHFLVSLLPFIQPLDPLEKLYLRSAMQQLVSDSYKEHEEKKRQSQRPNH